MKVIPEKIDGKVLSIVESGFVTVTESYNVKRNGQGSMDLAISIENKIDSLNRYRDFDAEDETYQTQWVDKISVTPLGENVNDTDYSLYLVIYNVAYRNEVESMKDYLKRIVGVK